jgi:hypothetical protein
MIAAPTPGHPLSMSRMVHAGATQNAGVANANYVDATGAYGWLYAGSFTGWKFYNNYNMTTGAIMSGACYQPVDEGVAG